MALDMNPNFSSTQQSVPNYQSPYGHQPVPQGNGTPPGAVANMIKAIMDGNDRYKKEQLLSRGSPQAQPGPPMSLAPPQDPTNPEGTGTSQPLPLPPPASPAPAPPAAPAPPPVPVQMTDPGSQAGALAQPQDDPVAKALMSQPPGMSNGYTGY